MFKIEKKGANGRIEIWIELYSEDYNEVPWNGDDSAYIEVPWDLFLGSVLFHISIADGSSRNRNTLFIH